MKCEEGRWNEEGGDYIRPVCRSWSASGRVLKDEQVRHRIRIRLMALLNFHTQTGRSSNSYDVELFHVLRSCAQTRNGIELLRESSDPQKHTWNCLTSQF